MKSIRINSDLTYPSRDCSPSTPIPLKNAESRRCTSHGVPARRYHGKMGPVPLIPPDTQSPLATLMSGQGALCTPLFCIIIKIAFDIDDRRSFITAAGG